MKPPTTEMMTGCLMCLSTAILMWPMMSTNDVNQWCQPMMSTKDVNQWCKPMTSTNDVKLWSTPWCQKQLWNLKIWNVFYCIMYLLISWHFKIVPEKYYHIFLVRIDECSRTDLISGQYFVSFWKTITCMCKSSNTFREATLEIEVNSNTF